MNAILETILFRESSGDLSASLLLAMPDHLHGLMSFRGLRPMAKVIPDFKGWLAKKHGIRWQIGFFDHRLRSWESAVEKRKYILENPVRAGLVADRSEWPYVLDRLRLE